MDGPRDRASDNFTCCHTWHRAGRPWLLSQPVGSGRPQRESSPGTSSPGVACSTDWATAPPRYSHHSHNYTFLCHTIILVSLASLSFSFKINFWEIHSDRYSHLQMFIVQLCWFSLSFPHLVNNTALYNFSLSSCLYTSRLLPRLLGACVKHLEGQALETPMGLIARLVLGNVIFVEQFATAVKSVKVSFVKKCQRLCLFKKLGWIWFDLEIHSYLWSPNLVWDFLSQWTSYFWEFFWPPISIKNNLILMQFSWWVKEEKELKSIKRQWEKSE